MHLLLQLDGLVAWYKHGVEAPLLVAASWTALLYIPATASIPSLQLLALPCLHVISAACPFFLL